MRWRSVVPAAEQSRASCAPTAHLARHFGVDLREVRVEKKLLSADRWIEEVRERTLPVFLSGASTSSSELAAGMITNPAYRFASRTHPRREAGLLLEHDGEDLPAVLLVDLPVGAVLRHRVVKVACGEILERRSRHVHPLAAF